MTRSEKRPLGEPIKQSGIGQLWDAIFLFTLMLGVLFAPRLLGISGSMKHLHPMSDANWQALGQNSAMASTWEQLGYTPESAHDIIAQRHVYQLDVKILAIIALTVLGYFFVLLYISRREYRDVISETFDAPKDQSSQTQRRRSSTPEN